MSNRLAQETSPYLLEHAENPVDWHPWGPEAIARARTEDKPIFLSIGYSACHWCHVMARESFENPAIAKLVNQHFVPIKVDREERPDLDQIYMNAVQMMTGRGGWPMSVFLTPDGKPFYGGTYWPPEPRFGMPGFPQVLMAVAEAWRDRRAQALEQADVLVNHLQQPTLPAGGGELDSDLLPQAARELARSFDATHGGFGGAPKFPHPMDLRLLLRAWKRRADEQWLHVVTFTLDKMAAGGIYDQLGGGFHRYSVDERWLVPHFEKMLYDNALLVPCYVEAFQITGNAEYARVARETCDYLLREMTIREGGLASTQDADSEGIEGKFFVWTPDEIERILGKPAAETFNYVYDVTREGNFEHGQSVLNLLKSLVQCAQVLGRKEDELLRELEASRAKLYAEREKRVHPHRDDKVLVAWNALAIEALVLAAGALDEPRYLAAAQRAARFVLEHMRRPDGRLWHSWRLGQAKFDAYLDDYACLIAALISLYEADFDEGWIDAAVPLADDLLAWFHDPSEGGFFYTASDHEALVARQKDWLDNATPSGNAMAAAALLRLGRFTGRAEYLAAAETTLHAAAAIMHQAPRAVAQMLAAADMYLGPTPEIVLLGDCRGGATAESLGELRRRYLPNRLVACRGAEPVGARSPHLAPLFAGKQLAGPEPGIFICQQFTCAAPIFGPEAARAAWDSLDRANSQ